MSQTSIGCSVDGFDMGVAAEHDDPVGVGDHGIGELLGCWSVMSTPISRSVWADRASTLSPGVVPAERLPGRRPESVDRHGDGQFEVCRRR